MAQAMTSFVAEYVAPTAPGTKSGSEQQRLAECPEHTLHPAALLQILYDLKEPFEAQVWEKPEIMLKFWNVKLSKFIVLNLSEIYIVLIYSSTMEFSQGFFVS